MFLLEDKINKSCNIIRNMLKLCSNPYLSLSFGKDSLVMMDLVTKIHPDIDCLFLKSEETFLIDNYEEVIKYYLSKGINIKIVSMRHLDYNFEDGENNEFRQDAFFDNRDGCFIGLRIGESKGRRMTLTSKAGNNVSKGIMQYKVGRRKNMFRCCPMAQWTSYEVYLYCKHYGLKMLNSYSSHKDRTSAQLPMSNTLRLSLNKIKTTDISRFNKIITMIPELRFYT
jgi:3'-phosphoadenosine 5'-phosphosulfate sulfotransferase (PAPS reductase)/FAD synthetase